MSEAPGDEVEALRRPLQSLTPLGPDRVGVAWQGNIELQQYDVGREMFGVSSSIGRRSQDKAQIFPARPDNRPFVARGGDGRDALRAFYDRRTIALRETRAGRGPSKLRTHVTPPIAPIRRALREFLRMHSRLGKMRHIPLARWSLGA